MKKRIALIFQNVLIGLYLVFVASVIALAVFMTLYATREFFGNVAMYSAIGVGVLIGFMVYAAAKWD